MLLAQKPTFVMVVTQEPTTIYIYIYITTATHAFQNHGMIFYYIPSSCKASARKPNFLKRINA